MARIQLDQVSVDLPVYSAGSRSLKARLLPSSRVAPGPLGIDGDERTDLRVECVDAPQCGVDELARRDLARTDQFGLLRAGEPNEFVVHGRPDQFSPKR